jgi:hypothetical protein
MGECLHGEAQFSHARGTFAWTPPRPLDASNVASAPKTTMLDYWGISTQEAALLSACVGEMWG